MATVTNGTCAFAWIAATPTIASFLSDPSFAVRTTVPAGSDGFRWDRARSPFEWVYELSTRAYISAFMCGSRPDHADMASIQSHLTLNSGWGGWVRSAAGWRLCFMIGFGPMACSDGGDGETVVTD